ncbi:hypothetical protein [Streptomyces mirabilis]|uniref:hypothetical protein n=1 Tax=Streptomyces mirabilis TaxID=68239 RepID=UPI0036A97C6C
MPTFEELFHVNLSPLQSAADDWAVMAVLLNKVAKEAGSMRSLAQGTEWKGENTSVTKPFVVRESDEFTDAVTEAESVGNLLSSAHDKIKAARDDLKALCANPPAGITIHADGTLSRSVQPQRRPATAHRCDRRPGGGSGLDLLLGPVATHQGQARVRQHALRLPQGREHRRPTGAADEDGFGGVHAAREVGQRQHQAHCRVPQLPLLDGWWRGGTARRPQRRDTGRHRRVPSAAGGEASKHLAKGALLSDVRGKHHRPTFINTIGKFGERIFSVPVSVVATGIDFYYTPNQPRNPGDTHVNAPAEPGKVRYQ